MSSKLKRFVGKGNMIKIDGEDVELMPLDVDSIPDLLSMIKSFSGVGDKTATMEELFKNVDEEGKQAIKRLVTAVVDTSFPDDDEKDRKKFGFKYFFPIIMGLMSINSSDIAAAIKKQKKEVPAEKLKKMMAHINKGKNEPGKTEVKPNK